MFCAGYASLAKLEPGHEPKYVPYNGQRVHGVLYKVSAEDLIKLQKREGGYVTQSTEVGVECTKSFGFDVCANPSMSITAIKVKAFFQ